jgi:predicted nucleic acid-binding protein
VVIIDSTVWVDYFNGLHNPETDWLDVQLDVQRLGLTTIIMCEVLEGVRDERQAAAVEMRSSWAYPSFTPKWCAMALLVVCALFRMRS